MGVLDDLKKFEVLLTNNIIFDSEQKLIMQVQTTPELHNDSGLMINRADLHLTLYDKVKNDVEFRFGKEVVEINQNDAGVNVSFSDGTYDNFDLVIGADGVNSKTRI